MGELTAEMPPEVSAQVIAGTREGVAGVTAILAGGPFAEPPDAYDDHGIPESASVFLGQLLFALNLANGKDPRNQDLLGGESRGQRLARMYLARPTLEICCDYCGGLMVQAIAAAVASTMKIMHGDAAAAAWDAFTSALIPPPRAA